MTLTYPMQRHKYNKKWSEFDYEKETDTTYLACQKRGTLVFSLQRGGSREEVLKPYWTMEDIAYKDEGWPINIVDAEGKQSTYEYKDLTIDWRFALDYAKDMEYTLKLKE